MKKPEKKLNSKISLKSKNFVIGSQKSSSKLNDYIIKINTPSKLSIKSINRDISTGETNICNNLKNEVIFLNNINVFRNNNLSNLTLDSTDKSPLYNSIKKNKIINFTKKNEKINNKIKEGNTNLNINDNNEDCNNSVATDREEIENNINFDSNDDKSIKKIIKKQSITQCLFCDKLCLDNNYFEFFKCKHYFCKECGNIFYKNLIQQGEDKNFKCPVFSCSSFFSNQFIKSLISLKINECQNNIKVKNENNHFERNDPMNIKESREVFLNKNIIDINTMDNFYIYIKKFLFECPECKDFSLYGKIKGPYFKCLKCLKKYCKYCREKSNDSHFDLSYKEHCKVYYRINGKKEKKNSFVFLYFRYMFLIIGGFLFIMTFFVNKLKNTIKIKNIGKRIVYTFIFILLSLVFTPLSLLLIPYFPIISSI
jgi:hypothetical protein